MRSRDESSGMGTLNVRNAVRASMEKELKRRGLSRKQRTDLRETLAYMDRYEKMKAEIDDGVPAEMICRRKLQLAQDLQEQIGLAIGICKVEFKKDKLYYMAHFVEAEDNDLQWRRFMRYNPLEEWFPDHLELVAELRRQFARRPDEVPSKREAFIEKREAMGML